MAKACLSPFLVTNWPQRHNLFHENPLTPRPHDSSPHQRFHMKSRVQFKFPTLLEDSDNQFPPPRDGKGVKCPAYARGNVEASI